ncbi:MAG: class I SAM-dependent methyltransferase [Elusimicrobia bacterium]|nr:class I SAM-dependent methyltransferase [Elusimicrobiota bacterium]
MKNPSSNLSDYYGRIGLNPVGHDISREKSLKLHERKRRSLLEHHLKIPFQAWKGARVLEFGPGSGENAVVLARHGAKLTFVEPLDYLIAELKGKFAALGVPDSIEAVHNEVLEKFETSERYDFVFGEGFVHFLDDPVEGVRRMSACVAPEGFLVLSVVHPVGTFIEFVKKAYLEMAAAALGRESGESRFALARKLFEGPFKAINHSRGFESWSKDCVLNPLYRPRHFLDLPEILAGLPESFSLYSSWPNYASADDLIWHKNIQDAAAVRAATLRGYYARAPHFLHSIPQPGGELPLFTPEAGKKILAALGACYRKLDGAIDRRETGPKTALAALAGLRSALRPHPQSKQALSVVDEALALFKDAARAPNEAALVRAWSRRALFQKVWGSPGHYFVLHNTGLFSGRS